MYSPPSWSRLDNTAKIFPASSSDRDSKVFRFFCELREQVEPELLQSALDQTLLQFPQYRSVMKRGLFWYYLEQSKLPVNVTQEDMPPCQSLYRPERVSLLFRVFYYRKRINLEVYHVLADGTGALQFLSTLVYHYLLRRYPGRFSDPPPSLPYTAAQSQLRDDGVQKYYEKPRFSVPSLGRRAYRLKGARLPEHRLGVIEGRLSVAAALSCARAKEATLTELMTAVMIRAIHEGMRLRDRRRPVIITVPVNLRNYFPSATASNFFSIISVSYDFSRQEDSLEAVLAHVRGSFREALTEERLHQRLNALGALEHNAVMRAVPLPVKNWILRAANQLGDRTSTAALSNVGRVTMPEGMSEYISLFGFFTYPNKLQASVCSFQDCLTVSFASPFRYHDMERALFRSLAQLGLEVTIAADPILLE